MATFVKAYYDADGDNSAQAMKATEGDLFTIEVQNVTTAPAWIQFFDTAAGSVTVGTTTPIQTFLVPPGDGTTPGVVDKNFYNAPLHFETAITYACTTTKAGNGDPTTGLTVNATYR